MMARTQITLERELLREARARASELGISLAAYVRGLLAKDLRHKQAAVSSSIIFGLGNSGGSDIARDKHRLVNEAWTENRVRKSAKR